MFRQLGIYSPGRPALPARGRRAADVLQARTEHGQILQEGINEAGAISSWHRRRRPPTPTTATPMIPFYIFYSMFGFQRVGDLIWAAGDSRARGFLIGGTAGPHDAQRRGPAARGRASHLLASTIPNCRAYDPAFAYELAVIVHDGLRRHARGPGGRLLLPDGDERELPPARHARRRRGRHPARHAPHPGERRCARRAHCSAPARSCAR